MINKHSYFRNLTRTFSRWFDTHAALDFASDKQTENYDLIKTLPIPQIKDYGLTPFAQAMPSQYKNKNPIAAYRDFYCGEKKNLLFWTKRMKPEWIKIN